MMRRLFVVAIVLLTVAATLWAGVDRVEIKSRADVLDGKPFGDGGAYEKIAGRVFFKVAALDVRNRWIVDLDNAPRDAAGEVEFSSDFYILRPKDAARGNGALLLEIPNRGGKGILRLLNGGTGSTDPSKESDFGDGFLLRKGFTIAWIGWQWDVVDDPGLMRLYAPVARDTSGPIRGLVRTDFTLPAKAFDVPLGHLILGRIGGKGYPVADPASPPNVLTVRDAPLSPRRVIPRNDWQFAREVNGKVTADNRWLHLDGGFEPGKIYELVFVAQDPVVAGLGLAAARDFISYLKYEKDAVASVKRAYAVGISQSGRFLRHFLYQDFNADEQNRQVLDGVIAHVAGGGRGIFNHRFAQPSRDAQPMSSLFFPTDLHPFTDLPYTDPTNGQRRGLLDATFRSKVAPKIFYTNTSYEYWSRAASPIHTTPDGKQDATIPDNVRIYLLAGLQHFSGPFPPAFGHGDLKGQQKQNPNPVQWFWRALITDMDEWVSSGTLPPPSTYPKLRDKMLVPFTAVAWPKIPGVQFPHDVLGAYHLDFGSQWKQGVISKEPPVIGRPFPILVPQVDRDGNDLGGVRPPELQVPLATHTGWNLRDPSIGAPTQRVSFIGSYIALAKTSAERKKSGDPRQSITERYGSREQYLNLYRQAAERLVKDRFYLQEDLPAVMERGGREWDEANK